MTMLNDYRKRAPKQVDKIFKNINQRAAIIG